MGTRTEDVRRMMIALIVADATIQIRDIDSYHLKDIEAVLERGLELKDPYLTIEKGTNRLVCGWHRYYAYKKVYGDEYEAPVKIRSFKNDNEAMLYSGVDNESHGKKLTPHEQRVFFYRLRDRGVTESTLLDMFPSWSKLKLADFRATSARIRVKTPAIGNEKAKTREVHVPIKKGLGHLEGRLLTQKQYRAIPDWQGWPVSLHARQLLLAFRKLDWDKREVDEKEVALLKEVRVEIDKYLLRIFERANK